MARYKSFTLKQSGWKLLSDDRIEINGCSYKFFNSRDIEGKIKTVTISRDAAGDFWVVFSVETEGPLKARIMTGKTAGLDFGLSMFMTLSDRETLQAPQPLLELLTQLREASRNVSRKQRGNTSRRKAVASLATLHRRITTMRFDWMHKTARQLAERFDVLCIEVLSLEGMKRLWGRKVSNIAWHRFVSALECHCQKAGSILVKVDRFYPGSKRCSECGFVNEDLTLKEREWLCPECGTLHDREENTAINTHGEGLRLFAAQCEAGHRLREEAA